MNNSLIRLFLVFSLFNVLQSQAQAYKVDFLGVTNKQTNHFYGLKIVPIGILHSDRSYSGITIGGVISFRALTVSGLSIGGLIYNAERLNGVQFSPLISNTDTLIGFSSTLSQYSKMFKGFGLGVTGVNFNEFKGIAVYPALNHSRHFDGVGISAVNFNVGHFRGIQIGVFNSTQSGQGIQIGLLNYIKENPSWCRILPVINFRFKKEIKEELILN